MECVHTTSHGQMEISILFYPISLSLDNLILMNRKIEVDNYSCIQTAPVVLSCFTINFLAICLIHYLLLSPVPWKKLDSLSQGISRIVQRAKLATCITYFSLEYKGE